MLPGQLLNGIPPGEILHQAGMHRLDRSQLIPGPALRRGQLGLFQSPQQEQQFLDAQQSPGRPGLPGQACQRFQQRRHSRLSRQSQAASAGTVPLQQSRSGDAHLREGDRQLGIQRPGIHRESQSRIVPQRELEPGITAALPQADGQPSRPEIESAAVPELPAHASAQAEAQLQKARLGSMPGMKSLGFIPLQAHGRPVTEPDLLRPAPSAALGQRQPAEFSLRGADLLHSRRQVPEIPGDCLLGPQGHASSSSPGQERAASCSMVWCSTRAASVSAAR